MDLHIFRDTVVEFLCRIFTHLLLTVIDRGTLHDHSDISTRTDRDVVADHLVA